MSFDASSSSLLQSPADRLLKLGGGWGKLWVITSIFMAQGIREQLPELPKQNLLVESQGRDSTYAVAWTS